MKKDITRDILRTVRKNSREEEIRLHGRPLPKSSVRRSKKVYDRKREKARFLRGKQM